MFTISMALTAPEQNPRGLGNSTLSIDMLDCCVGRINSTTLTHHQDWASRIANEGKNFAPVPISDRGALSTNRNEIWGPDEGKSTGSVTYRASIKARRDLF